MPYAKFGAKPFPRGFWANRWNITLLLLFIYLLFSIDYIIYRFFFNSPTGQTFQQILTYDGSETRTREVPFGGLKFEIIIEPLLCLQRSNFGKKVDRNALQMEMLTHKRHSIRSKLPLIVIVAP